MATACGATSKPGHVVTRSRPIVPPLVIARPV